MKHECNERINRAELIGEMGYDSRKWSEPPTLGAALLVGQEHIIYTCPGQRTAPRHADNRV